MKVTINDKELCTLSDIKKKVICNDIPAEIVEDDLQRRVAYILAHKYERCMDRLKKEWLPKLKSAGVQNIPLDDDAFAQLVFSQPNYKDRSTRELAQAPSKAEYDKAIIDTKNQVKRQLEAEKAKF